MIGVSSIMSWVMAYTMIPTAIANAMLSLSSNKYVILLLMNVILLVVGTFMDPTPAVLILRLYSCPSARALAWIRCSSAS